MDETVFAGTSTASDVEIMEVMELCTPPEIIEKAKEVTLNLLPEKSKKKYDLQYNLFMKWCASNQVKKYSENVILTYMFDLSKKYKSSTLWSIYSMLKATLSVKNNIDISSYIKVIAFLKKKGVGYIAKKSKTFSGQEINTFLREAPDEIHLMTKVVLIIGIAGACRTDELTNMTVDDVQNKDDILIIHIPNTKKFKQRTFTVCNPEKENSIDIVSICKTYFNLRPKNMNSRRLFIKYYNRKCAAQNVGHHTIGAVPSKIAAYLNISNSKEYTGHCFRRTSATLLADSGADILTLKRHGGWKSTTVTEGYIEDSIVNKISVAKKILTDHAQASGKQSVVAERPLIVTDTPEASNEHCPASTLTEQIEMSNLSKQGLMFSKCTISNPVFNINISNN